MWFLWGIIAFLPCTIFTPQTQTQKTKHVSCATNNGSQQTLHSEPKPFMVHTLEFATCTCWCLHVKYMQHVPPKKPFPWSMHWSLWHAHMVVPRPLSVCGTCIAWNEKPLHGTYIGVCYMHMFGCLIHVQHDKELLHASIHLQR